MARYTIEIDDEIFEGETASAVDQMEALHIAGRTLLVPALEANVADMTLVASLLQVPLSDCKRLADLVVKGGKGDSLVQRARDEVPVAENLFKDDIQYWFLLVGKALRENLGPFYKLRRQIEGPAAESTN